MKFGDATTDVAFMESYSQTTFENKIVLMNLICMMKVKHSVIEIDFIP